MTMSSAINHNNTRVALDWVKKLANGINPLDGSTLSDNDIVNNIHISRCLFYVAELIEGIGHEKTPSGKQYERDFYLPPEELKRVSITERSTISVLVREINKVKPENMKPLPIPRVTNWLVRIGYLEDVLKDDGHKTRIPSELGKSIGISSELKSGPNGEYMAVLYDANAQRFILDNLFKK